MSHEPVEFDLPALLQELDSNLAAYERDFPLEDFKKGHFQQHPFVTLLSCCDARVAPAMLGDTFNRVFCIENIGNQVNNNLGSILYGLLHLHTPLMLVAGHSDCGAIKAATSDYAAEPAAIVNELNVVKASLERACAGIKIDLTEAAKDQARLSQINVDDQIQSLLAHDKIAPLVEKGDLQIIGLLVDLHDVCGQGYGKVFTVNVNGEKDIEAIKKNAKIGGFAAKARRLA